MASQVPPHFFREKHLSMLSRFLEIRSHSWASHHLSDDSDVQHNMSQPWWAFLDEDVLNATIDALVKEHKSYVAERLV